MHKNIYAGLFVLSAVFLPKAASAGVNLVFQNDGNATTTPGAVISMAGTITNTATSSVVYLNSLANLNIIPSNEIASPTPGSVVIDEIASKSYLPMILNSGQQYINALVKVDVNSSAKSGDYMGMYTLNAGSSTSTNEYVSTQYFIIHVMGTTPTPPAEPSSATATSSFLSGLQMPTGLEYQDNLNLNGSYQTGPRLIKLENDSTVYWVSPNNLKIPMVSAEVFLSYGNKWTDVVTVPQSEFDYYQTAKYIWLNGSGAIYKIKDGVRKYIPSAIWNPAGIDPSAIINVNKIDLNSYTTGNPLTTAEELN